MRLRLVPRAPWEKRPALLYGLIGLLLGLALCSLTGIATPLGVEGIAKTLFRAFISPSSYISSTPFYAAIALSAAGLAIAYRAGFVTIGAEGQLVLGVVLTYGLLVFHLDGAERVVGIAAAVTVSGLVGGLYGALVGYLRAYLEANETLVSLMMNFIAIAIANYLISGPWKVGAFVMTPAIPEKFRLEGLYAAVIATAIIAALEAAHRYTRLGIAADSVGLSRLAAETYGVNPKRVYVLVSFISGVSAGIGGTLYALSINTPLTSISKGGLGFGYMGILAAWLAGLNILGSIAAGMLLAILYSMTATLQLWGIKPSVVYAFESVLVISTLLAVTLSKYRLVMEK